MCVIKRSQQKLLPASASQKDLSRIRLARKEKIDDGGCYEQHLLDGAGEIAFRCGL